ncbi:hypothetical protein CGRA01v4_11353 [Colletotrichum graminicola]|nr:hypothetical protein CGRA01v4_11353 [Colletotrichum graminicola]
MTCSPPWLICSAPGTAAAHYCRHSQGFRGLTAPKPWTRVDAGMLPVVACLCSIPSIGSGAFLRIWGGKAPVDPGAHRRTGVRLTGLAPLDAERVHKGLYHEFSNSSHMYGGGAWSKRTSNVVLCYISNQDIDDMNELYCRISPSEPVKSC